MRAQRRHKLEVLKEKVKKYYGGTTDPKRIGHLANTRTPCSCAMCCNPRRRGEKTLQEKRLENEPRILRMDV
jgi:hypothetical protein